MEPNYMKKNNLGMVCWGIVLVALDYQLNGIDVLPDILGYALVLWGFRGLAREEGSGRTRFGEGVYAAAGLLILAAVEQTLTLLSLHQVLAVAAAWYIAVFAVDALLYAAMGWVLLRSLSVWCEASGDAQTASQCRIYAVVFIPVAAVSYLFSKISGGTLYTISFLVYILISVGLLMMARAAQNAMDE